MVLQPKPGLVIRYDFLWKKEGDAGVEHGNKDRPCAIILAVKLRENSDPIVVVCPITHSPPAQDETGIEIPAKVARHLGLDDGRSWIKTHEVNTFEWPEGQIPYGVSPARENDWAFGLLPYDLARRVHEQVRANSRRNNLEIVRRG